MQVTIEDVQVNSGERAQFQAVIEGTPQPTVLWFKVSADSSLAESEDHGRDCSALFHGKFLLLFPPTPLTLTLCLWSWWNQLFSSTISAPHPVLSPWIFLQREQPRWFWRPRGAGRKTGPTWVSLRCAGMRLSGLSQFSSVTSQLRIFSCSYLVKSVWLRTMNIPQKGEKYFIIP